MKFTRVFTFLTAIAISLICFVFAPTPAAVLAVGVSLIAVSNLLCLPSANLYATLSATEILQDTLEAFKVMFPALFAFTTNFSGERVAKDQTIIAHIPTLPTVQDYHATLGFGTNQAEAEALLTDVPVTLDRLKHVPVRVRYLNAIQSQKDLYATAIKNQAYVLGKEVIDYALSLTTAANFSHVTAEADVDLIDVTTLENIRSAANIQGMSNLGRVGIVQPNVAKQIQDDTVAGSSDFYGQLNGAGGYRVFKNISGFENIWEYPDFPANAEDLGGFFFDPRAITMVSRVPDVQSSVEALGIPQIARVETVTDPDSGLSFMIVQYQEQGTLDVRMTVALLYGITAGKQAGSADTICDQGGHRLTVTGS